MQYKFFLIWVILLLTSVGGMAQNETEDVLYLQNGEIIKGQILEYDPNANVKIKILGGSILVYKSEEVLKMEKEPRKTSVKTINPNKSKLKEKGVYHSIMGGTVYSLYGRQGLGFGAGPVLPMGFSVDYTVGYQFHRLFGVGLNLGFLMPNFEAFVPICANVRGYIMKKTPSLYYDVNVGFGLALSGIGWDGARKGGLHFRPAIGVIFPSAKKGHFSMDLGYVMQFGGVNQYANYAITLKIGVTF